MCKQDWCFSINILSKLSLLPLLVPFGCSWLLRSQTEGLLRCRFITLSLLLSSQGGSRGSLSYELGPQAYLSLQQFFPCLEKLLFFSPQCFLFTFNLAQPLLQCKLWLGPGSFLVLAFAPWRKCLYNPERIFFDVAATWILGLLTVPAFRSFWSLSMPPTRGLSLIFNTSYF